MAISRSACVTEDKHTERTEKCLSCSGKLSDFQHVYCPPPKLVQGVVQGAGVGSVLFTRTSSFSDEKLRLTVALYAAPVEQGALGLLLCPRLGLLIPAAQGDGPWLPL